MGKHAVVQLIPEIPKVIPAPVREKISTALHALLDASEALIQFIDGIDGDETLEDDGTLEPSIGTGAHIGGDDLELDDADDEPDADNEPYLSTGTEHWAIGGGKHDQEIDHVAVEALP